jgi:Rod binding domain-containing protein
MIDINPTQPTPTLVPHKTFSVGALREKATEFEGILLAEMLQKMSACCGAPGSENSDSTGESFQSLATSALGGGLARSGGIGIGDLLVRSLSPGLRKADNL